MSNQSELQSWGAAFYAAGGGDPTTFARLKQQAEQWRQEQAIKQQQMAMAQQRLDIQNQQLGMQAKRLDLIQQNSDRQFGIAQQNNARQNGNMLMQLNKDGYAPMPLSPNGEFPRAPMAPNSDPSQIAGMQMIPGPDNQMYAKNNPGFMFGFDTSKYSPEELQQKVKEKDPSEFRFLESMKNGDINLAGRTSNLLLNKMKAVETLWPGTDLTTVQSRIATRKEFSPAGQTGRSIMSLNTALLHQDQLIKLAEKVNNKGLLASNKLSNLFKTQTSDPDVAALKDVIEKYNRESAKAIAGAGQVYVSDLQENSAQLSAAQSLDVIKNVVKNRTKLLGGRTQPYLEAWKNTMGDAPIKPLINPSSQKALKKLGLSFDPDTGEVLDNSADTAANTIKDGWNNAPSGIKYKVIK